MSLPKPAGRYLKVAHRGASALAPENSLAALDAALAAEVDMVELDVLALDGRLRLAHSAAQVQPDSPALEEALRLSGERTYSAAVQRALADFVRRAKAGRILELAGRGLWEGDLSAMRADRTGRRRRAS